MRPVQPRARLQSGWLWEALANTSAARSAWSCAISISARMMREFGVLGSPFDGGIHSLFDMLPIAALLGKKQLLNDHQPSQFLPSGSRFAGRLHDPLVVVDGFVDSADRSQRGGQAPAAGKPLGIVLNRAAISGDFLIEIPDAFVAQPQREIV